MQIDGQCNCGRVTYQAEIDPDRVSICHCTDCQTLTGSPYRVTAVAAREAVRVTGGDPKIYAKTGDNGLTRFQYFCPDCGPPDRLRRRRCLAHTAIVSSTGTWSDVCCQSRASCRMV